ncbi:hypothetical protein IRR91_001053 [Salmonella enterica]|uniref:Fimbrial protein FimI n=1 Tax=Salmonella enterica subsp. arizonae serovar 48:z4,z24:- TaxID=1967584 RepID=A0A738X6U3_SALER|nr:hypothetical protein [Salmonella enterica]EAN8611982.1 hypothetical protein [Salmonella enterica subsp. arizonae serovar 48:z4,z24:-]EAW3054140.1 hypothetical protein [Salmonella enterica subsp. enterica]ECP3268510.1 hypothetical protein [Salmonella enterica subsp. enterica serovar [1],13,23:g,z51:-]ECT1272374.1 hypothetical protein [Salmonella enterica subsp. houtenae serovar 48:g,z51:-]EDR1778285.1 hypothetical protein [Salmonella enterica subsp. arizonae]
MIRKGAALVGLLWLSPVIAQPVMVESGRVHLRGQLVNGEGIGDAGIGLALFDDQQRQIISNSLPLHYAPILTQEMTFHFTARYRAISENMTPGRIHSEVWFTLVYP